MKKTLLFMLLALICTTGCHAQKTMVWENPNALYDFSGNAKFTVTKMEFKKNETVMHVNAKFIPHYWIKFAKESVLKTEDGKEYALISGEPTKENESRIEPDSLFWMPDNGKANLALHFKPLPLKTKKVDFIEGHNEGAFRFWNISDAKNTPTLPKEWSNIKYADNEMLPETILKKGVATLKVWMMDYKPGMDVTLLVVGTEPLTDKNAIELEIKMDDNGCAIAEIPLFLTRQVTFWINDTPTATCLIAPGETTECIINPYKELEGRYTFRGYMARTNMDVFKARLKIYRGNEGGKTLYEALQRCTTVKERFNVLVEEILKKEKAIIDKQSDLCDAAKAMARMESEDKFLDWIYNFGSRYTELLTKLKIEKYAESWDEMKERIIKYMALMPYPEIKDTLDTMEFEVFIAPYATCSDTFWNRYHPTIKEDSADVKLSLFESIYGVRQIVKGNDKDKAYDRYTKHITDPGCLAALSDFRANQERIMQELKAYNNINYGTLDSVAPENILTTILDKYKGKAVLIDIWQTWCGPCRYGHKMLAPVKEELKNKDIAFVYITSPSSPVTKWQNMVTEISGDHYYLTNEQYSYVMDKIMDSKGVPTYAIYDTDGNQTYKAIGFPGEAVIKAELEKVIK